MSKRSNSPNDEFDWSAVFSDPDFELEAFIEFMAAERGARDKQPARQRLDDLREARWLRDQLYDWDDRARRNIGDGRDDWDEWDEWDEWDDWHWERC